MTKIWNHFPSEVFWLVKSYMDCFKFFQNSSEDFALEGNKKFFGDKESNRIERRMTGSEKAVEILFLGGSLPILNRKLLKLKCPIDLIKTLRQNKTSSSYSWRQLIKRFISQKQKFGMKFLSLWWNLQIRVKLVVKMWRKKLMGWSQANKA